MKYDMIKPNQPHLHEATVKRWTRSYMDQSWKNKSGPQTPWSLKYRYRKLVALQRPAPCIDTLFFVSCCRSEPRSRIFEGSLADWHNDSYPMLVNARSV